MITTDDATTNEARRPDASPDWHKTACILCECNCGIEIRGWYIAAGSRSLSGATSRRWTGRRRSTQRTA
jgi:hypothetical protein